MFDYYVSARCLVFCSNNCVIACCPVLCVIITLVRADLCFVSLITLVQVVLSFVLYNFVACSFL